jgi:glycosyltransferase involved in cell wall biosynthesis
MSARVSVLIPCHNAAAYVGATLTSVLNQTWGDLEIIVVDDGSSDGSRDVLAAVKDRRLETIHSENRGAAAARNSAFAASSGTFVLYLDADDVIGPEHVARLHTAIANTRGKVALGEWDRFQRDPDEAMFPSRATYIDAAGPEWLAIDWMAARPMTQCGMALIPRHLVETHGGWDERLSLIDDFEFFARIIARSAGVRHAAGARLYYRSGLRGSLSGRKSREAVESAFLSLMLGTEHLIEAEDSPRSRRACANVLQDFDYTYYPEYADLRAKVRARALELGGADLSPDGPPGFHRLRRLVGWRAARRVQRFAETAGFNSAARRAP